MAIKFTEREMIGIRRKLKDYARRTVVHTSMQKITIGDLAKAAGISQSAFYKFYDSKELLFFEIMEDMHSDLAENMNKSSGVKRPAAAGASGTGYAKRYPLYG